MYASTQPKPVTYTSLFRSCGRIGGIIVMVSWVALVVNEALRHGAPTGSEYIQAAMIFVVFAGYVAGWWKEMFGGVLALAGTAALYIFCLKSSGVAPPPQGLLLAVPGVFYLLAWTAEHTHISRTSDLRHEH
jgi:hypothetical protein